MEKLSERQQQVYNYIKKYFDENGFCPSLADVARGVNLHESTTAVYVETLKKKGAVTSSYRIARSLRVVEPAVAKKT